MLPSTQPAGQATRIRGSLLLADISGFTGFLQGVADAHRDLIVEAEEPPAAYGLLTSLLDTMSSVIAPPFELVKFEGDAVFAVAPDAGFALRGPAIVDCVRACHAAFQARLAAANTIWSCTCTACARINDLGVKFVLHHGEYFVQPIAGREELLGPDVNIAHRLLKNHVADLIGARPYVLFTDAGLDALDIPVVGMVAATETYERLPPIAVHVLALD